MYHQFYIQQFYALPTQCIYVFFFMDIDVPCIGRADCDTNLVIAKDRGRLSISQQAAQWFD